MFQNKTTLLVGLMIAMALTLPVSGADAEKGKEIYSNYCLSCHGENGDGLKNMGVDFSDPDFWTERTDEELREVIENGKGTMPAWKGTLNSDDIDSVVMYLKSFSNELPSVSDTSGEKSERIKETPRTEVETKSQPGFEIILVFLAVLVSILLLKRR